MNFHLQIHIMKTLHTYSVYIVAICIGCMLICACSKDDDIMCPSSIDQGSPLDSIDFPDHYIHDSIPESFLADIDRQEPTVIMDPCDIRLPNGVRGCDYVRYQGRSYVGHEAMLMARVVNKALSKRMKSSDPYSGMSPHQAWGQLLSDMTIVARYLTAAPNFQYPHEGPMSPAHTGIAYVYGAKQFHTRTNATAWGGCAENLFGLDCSGFLQHVFFAGELDFPEGPAVLQGSVGAIQQALATHMSTSGLGVHNMGPLSTGDMIAGDIVYWNQLSGSAASHIGFVGERIGGGLVVYQSNGSRINNCPANYGSQRGARAFDLSNDYWFGSGAHWHVVRITPQGMSQNPCNTLSAESAWDFGNSGASEGSTLNVYEIHPEDGTPPYQYAFNMGQFQSENNFQTSIHGPHICTIRDAYDCEVTIAL